MRLQYKLENQARSETAIQTREFKPEVRLQYKLGNQARSEIAIQTREAS